MPHFSIYAPLGGSLHYLTITLIGFNRGVLIKWTPHGYDWKPQVLHLKDIKAFNGSSLIGYHLVSPETIDTLALEAMTGKQSNSF